MSTRSTFSGAKRAVTSSLDLRREPDVARPRLGFNAADAARDHRGHPKAVYLERESTRVDARELEEVVDEQRKESHLLAEDRDVLVRVSETVLERFEHRLHVGEWRAQVVARPSYELASRVEEAAEICTHFVE